MADSQNYAMLIKSEAIEPFVIRIDEDQFVLIEIKTSEKGIKYEHIYGYFINLAILIRRIVQIKIARNEEIKTLVGFISEWKSVQKQITEAIKDVTPSQ